MSAVQKRKEKPADEDECWVPQDLFACHTVDAYSPKELVACRKYVETCCTELKERFEFPKTFTVPDTPRDCSMERLANKAKTHFTKAGYDAKVFKKDSVVYPFGPIYSIEISPSAKSKQLKMEKEQLDAALAASAAEPSPPPPPPPYNDSQRLDDQQSKRQKV